jgi:hypothetical protein
LQQHHELLLHVRFGNAQVSLHVHFVDLEEFLSVDFLDREYLGELEEANLSDPFTDLLYTPILYIVNLPLKSNVKVISTGYFDYIFILKRFKSLYLYFPIILS